MSWTFNKPTKSGWYMINNGDVVTENNMEPVRVFENSEGQLMLEDFSKDIVPVKDINSSWKFLNISTISKKLDT